MDGFMRNLRQKKLYQEIESTKEYQETYWYHQKYEDNTKDIIPLNKFWCDFGIFLLSDKDKKEKMEFLSKWIILTSSNIHEIICCLAVLDLSFESNGPKYDYIEQKENISSAIPLKLKCDDSGSIVFIKQIVTQQRETTKKDRQQSSI